MVVSVVVTEGDGRHRSHLHLVVRLLVVIFLVDVVIGSISSILLPLVLRIIGMLSKDGIDLETETVLREMSLQEVRVGIIVVNENSLLGVRPLSSFVENNRINFLIIIFRWLFFCSTS